MKNKNSNIIKFKPKPQSKLLSAKNRKMMYMNDHKSIEGDIAVTHLSNANNSYKHSIWESHIARSTSYDKSFVRRNENNVTPTDKNLIQKKIK